MSRITIRHEVGDVVVETRQPVDRTRLRRSIRETLDTFAGNDRVPASVVQDEIRDRHGDDYLTPGFNLRAYRHRADMTQAELAAAARIHQHHVSEMERNIRPIGKQLARRLAQVLHCDYRRLL